MAELELSLLRNSVTREEKKGLDEDCLRAAGGPPARGVVLRGGGHILVNAWVAEYSTSRYVLDRE